RRVVAGLGASLAGMLGGAPALGQSSTATATATTTASGDASVLGWKPGIWRTGLSARNCRVS
ncbi:MAG: hypothetical protein VXW22_15205, partial [Pseudomonadota bacterium]|nr:hypothetical protein [Pseudomonadota bacterium]